MFNIFRKPFTLKSPQNFDDTKDENKLQSSLTEKFTREFLFREFCAIPSLPEEFNGTPQNELFLLLINNYLDLVQPDNPLFQTHFTG